MEMQNLIQSPEPQQQCHDNQKTEEIFGREFLPGAGAGLRLIPF